MKDKLGVNYGYLLIKKFVPLSIIPSGFSGLCTSGLSPNLILTCIRVQTNNSSFKQMNVLEKSSLYPRAPGFHLLGSDVLTSL